MMRSRFSLIALALTVGLGLWGCASKQTPAHAADTPSDQAAAQPSSSAATQPVKPAVPARFLAGGTIPVEEDDAVHGGSQAIVTIVAFSDLQCPFTARVQPTLDEILHEYGSSVRIVFKHNPLPFHKQARPAAIASQVVLAKLGQQAFWEFTRQLFNNQGELGDELYEKTAVQLGMDLATFRSAVKEAKYDEQVQHDIDVSHSVGVNGTPGFRINGVLLSGAQPLPKFASVIDAELPAAAAALANVGSLAGAYEQRVTENFKPGSVAPREPAKPDTRLWKVPVAGSPTLGPPDALVTIVQFQDLQCPFCAKVQATLDEVVAKYGDKVRIVFKHNPLPFHDRARPAAELAQYAFKKKGKDAFFGVARTLFLNQKDLTDQTFSNVASQFGLDPAAALASVHAAAFEKVIATDQQLASNLEARGTPHFFVNGHRLTGAQPLSTFVERIDAELATAEEALKKGIPKSKLYEYLTKEGLTETVPELKDVAAPPSNQPRMGAKRPQIEVQMFADLQCPFSARAQPTIRELMKAYPGRLSVVWRHMPLPFHEHAPLAGEALQEAFAQKGSEAFWKMAEILFANQDKLTFDDLLHVAGEVGLDQQAFKAALTDHRHRPIVEADMAVAKSIGVNGVPAFTINGYFISGAQGLAEYKRVVEYALKHPKK